MKLRNIGIIAHVDAGKTTTTERMLYMAGYTKIIGNVDSGTTITDFLPQERARGITIQSCSIPIHYKNHKINIIDTPGHVDFQFEVEKSLRILDGCVVILDGVGGVEAQTIKVWKQANQYQKPRIIFVNKMDRLESLFRNSVESIEKNLKGWGQPLVCQLPVFYPIDQLGLKTCKDNSGGIFKQIIDLVHFKQFSFNNNGSINEAEIDADLLSDAKLAREQLVEKVANLDERVLDLFVTNDMDIPNNELKAGLRRVVLNGSGCPVLLGSGFKNIGVQLLLDAIIDYLPSPIDVVEKSDSNDLSALAFKVTKDPTRGLLTFVRVYNGTLRPKEPLLVSTNYVEKATKLFEIYANEFKQVESIQSGHIGVVQGLKNCKTGDTIRTGNANLLDPIYIPQPVFVRQLHVDSLKDEKHLLESLNELVRDDPSLRTTNEEGEILLSGLGELHLEIAKDRLQDMKCKFTMGPISISYREKIESEIQEFVHFERDIGGKVVECGLELSISMDSTIDTNVIVNLQESDLYQDENFQPFPRVTNF